ncbi:hypothetical protein [Tardiphaga sp.]|jgi:hypothetical protein|uniref:hypothetical protein n=1 Tax=Tardiphaga sp. TaxID=1926292 RepID=UPI0037DA197C
MNVRAVRVTYPYRLTCVPKGSRNERTLLVKGETTAAISVVEKADVIPAYRLHYPADAPVRFTWPRAKIGKAWFQERADIELVRHADKLWWPWRDIHSASRYAVSTIDRLVETLAEGGEDILALLPAGMNAEIVQRPAVRSVSFDEIDIAAARVQRKIFENFLIVEERLYVRGGEPVYLKNHRGRARTWEIQIASVGADRAIDPRQLGIDPPGDQDEFRVQESFADGSFWMPHMHDAAKAAAHRMQADVPTIEIIGESVQLDRAAITIDAIFRRTQEMVKLDRWLQHLATSMLGCGEGSESNAALTFARASVVRDILAKNIHWHFRYRNLARQFAHFEHSHPEVIALSTEDDDALTSLVDDSRN